MKEKKVRSETYLEAFKKHVEYNNGDFEYMDDLHGICCIMAFVLFGSASRYEDIDKKNYPELYLFKKVDSAYWVNWQYDPQGNTSNSDLCLNELRQTILLLCHEMSKTK